MASLSCLFCGHGLAADAKFCSSCGNPLHFKPCTFCDAVNPREASACWRCDHALGQAAPLPSQRDPFEAEPAHADEVRAGMVFARAEAVEAGEPLAMQTPAEPAWPVPADPPYLPPTTRLVVATRQRSGPWGRATGIVAGVALAAAVVLYVQTPLRSEHSGPRAKPERVPLPEAGTASLPLAAAPGPELQQPRLGVGATAVGEAAPGPGPQHTSPVAPARKTIAAVRSDSPPAAKPRQAAAKPVRKRPPTPAPVRLQAQGLERSPSLPSVAAASPYRIPPPTEVHPRAESSGAERVCPEGGIVPPWCDIRTLPRGN